MRQVLMLCASLLAIACGDDPASPQAELRAWVARGESAVEERDRGTLIGMTSPDYADARGHDIEALGDLLRLYFFRHRGIALLISIDDIIVTAETSAVIDLTVAMAGSGGAVPGFSADAYRFELDVHKPDDEWLLIGARWAELGQTPR